VVAQGAPQGRDQRCPHPEVRPGASWLGCCHPLWMVCPVPLYRLMQLLVCLACFLIEPTPTPQRAVWCRLRKQRGTEVDCDAVGAAASAATLFRRHGSSTTLAGQPLPARGNGGGSSIWSWGPFRLLGRRRLRQTQQQDDRVAGGQQQQAADQGQQRHQQGGEGARRQAADLLQRHYYKPLSDTCYLVARKFAPDAVLVSKLAACGATKLVWPI
jgi:hypothetical protein